VLFRFWLITSLIVASSLLRSFGFGWIQPSMITPRSPIATSVLPFWTTTAGAGADATAYLNSGALLSSTAIFAMRRLQRSGDFDTRFRIQQFRLGKQMRRDQGRSPGKSAPAAYCGTLGIRLDRLEA